MSEDIHSVTSLYIPVVFFICIKGAAVMNDEARKLRNAYARDWRAKNKDKVKAHQEKYWSNKVLKEKINSKEGK